MKERRNISKNWSGDHFWLCRGRAITYFYAHGTFFIDGWQPSFNKYRQGVRNAADYCWSRSHEKVLTCLFFSLLYVIKQVIDYFF